MKASQLRQYVIIPTLEMLGHKYASPAAVELLLGTACTESRLEYLHQVNGPALGIYQIEPATDQDVWDNYLVYRDDIKDRVIHLLTEQPRHHQLITNLSYATAIARLIYWRAPDGLPGVDDVQGLAEYWKKHYNTIEGSGTVEHFIESYKRLAYD